MQIKNISLIHWAKQFNSLTALTALIPLPPFAESSSAPAGLRNAGARRLAPAPQASSLPGPPGTVAVHNLRGQRRRPCFLPLLFGS